MIYRFQVDEIGLGARAIEVQIADARAADEQFIANAAAPAIPIPAAHEALLHCGYVTNVRRPEQQNLMTLCGRIKLKLPLALP